MVPSSEVRNWKQGFYHGGAKLYNSLPLKLRVEPHLSKFKILLIDFKF